MRTARIKAEGAGYYHVMSRILERRRILQEDVIASFHQWMRKVEAFSGVQVVTYCLMGNHVHLLLRVPERRVVSDEELLTRLRQLSSPRVYRAFEVKWNRLLKQTGPVGVAAMRSAVLKRMYDLSAFMKELKLRFSQGYNRKMKRKGPLWEERFKSVLIEGSPGYLAAAAVYIDLNPVRARMVKDPGEYQYSGYGEALRGAKQALAGLAVITAAHGVAEDGMQVVKRYGRRLAASMVPNAVDEAVRAQEKADEPQEEGWRLALRRLRWLSEGAVAGSQQFVAAMRDRWWRHIGWQRPGGACATLGSTNWYALRPHRGTASVAGMSVVRPCAQIRPDRAPGFVA